MYTYKPYLIFFAVLSLSGCQPRNNQQPTATAVEKPNIIVILADDFGVGDIQAHYPNNKIPTPYLDRLVDQGMSFTDAHSASAVCTPTRYGLLTGRYCWRTGLQEWVLAAYEPPLIAAERLTLPGFLSNNGYQTACVGKWHLGWEWPGETNQSRMLEERNGLKHEKWDFSKPILEGPIQRGFDYYFGVGVPNFPPFTYIENDRIVDLPTEKYAYHPDQGVVMPRGFEGCPIAPDWRFDRILPDLTERAVQYIHDHAADEAPFFLYFSMTSPHEPVSPSEKFKGKSGIAPIADFVMETDWSAGQIIEAVEKAGIANNTLLIFTADNGHSHYTGWEHLIEAGHKISGPYRGHKGNIWEGGHRVPFVVRWPGKIKEGTANRQMVCLNDIFATTAELLGQSLPADAAEDSYSFLKPLLEHQSNGERNTLVNHSVDGEFAYRNGPWKIVFEKPTDKRATSRGKATLVKLFNLDEDVGEENDLAASRPELVAQMTNELAAVVDKGRSTPGPDTNNDSQVDFLHIQKRRWMPE